MSRAASLTAEARAGYDGNANPHLYSSACWYAHSLGRYLHDSGHAPPRAVHMSRGSSVVVDSMRFHYDAVTGWERVS